MWNTWQVIQTICALILLIFFTVNIHFVCINSVELSMSKFHDELFYKRYQTHPKDVIDTCRNSFLEHDQNISPSVYHIAVITKPSNQSAKWCGGTLISRKHFLTAAHCLEESNKTTIVFYNEKSNIQYTIESSCIKRHPKWQPQLLSNDIALIELPRTLHLPDLNPIDISQNVKVTSKSTTVYGWKKNTKNQPILSKYEVMIVKNKHCAKYYGSLITKQTICVKGNGHEDGCHGFSGSGLVVEGSLVAVMSFGTEPCDAEYPKVYTKVSSYRKWIGRNIGEGIELCDTSFTVSDKN